MAGEIFGVLFVVGWAGVVLGVGLLTHGRRRSFWERSADALGLDPPARGEPLVLSRDGLELVVTGRPVGDGQEFVRIELRGLDPRLRLERDSAFSRTVLDAKPLHDPSFDGLFHVGGDRAAALALLDGATREALYRLPLPAFGIEDGVLATPEDGMLTTMVLDGGLFEPLLAVGRRLGPGPEGEALAEALLARAREVQIPELSAACVEAMVHAHPRGAPARLRQLAAERGTPRIAACRRLAEPAVWRGVLDDPAEEASVRAQALDALIARGLDVGSPGAAALEVALDASGEDLRRVAWSALRGPAGWRYLARLVEAGTARWVEIVPHPADVVDDATLAEALAAHAHVDQADALLAMAVAGTEGASLLDLSGRAPDVEARVALIAAVGRVGTVRIVAPLKALSEGGWGIPGTVSRAARRAIDAAQARAGDVAAGRLSLSGEATGGSLSVADDDRRGAVDVAGEETDED